MLKTNISANFIKYIFLLQTFYISFSLSAEVQKSNPESSSEIRENILIRKSDKNMIVCADKRAAVAAKKIIKKGGNALDAAIAAQNVLSVVEPQSSGIGGGGFLIFFNNSTKKIYAWDGREFAPSSANSKMFEEVDGKKKPFLQAVSSESSIGVPGLYSMLADAHREYGSFEWKDLFVDAISLSRGFEISKRLNFMLNWAPHLTEDNYAQEIYFSDGKAKNIGEVVINRKLTKTLIEISKNPYSVNNGKIAVLISSKIPKNITIDDLSSWKTIKRKPICRYFFNYKICGFPPPTSGGIGVLQIIGILDNLLDSNINKLKSSEHLFLEASRLAYSDRDAYVADPDYFEVPVKELLSKPYLKKRSKEIKLKKATLEVKPGEIKKLNGVKLNKSKTFEKSSTTHISIVDHYGNAVSLTSSIEFAFGSGKTVGGFFLNNQLTDFSYSNKENYTTANSIVAMKKPRSSMAPTVVFRNNSLQGVIGSPGGSRIICYVSRSLLYLISQNSLKKVLNAPHICSRNQIVEIEKDRDTLYLEKKLSLLGQKLVKKKMTSGLNIIWKKNNVWYGGSDPRREGIAIGF